MGISMVGVEEGREFRFRGDLYSQKSTFPLVVHCTAFWIHICLFTRGAILLTIKKLSYRRGTARCVVSVEILPIATQQCRNYLYGKSRRNRSYEVGGLQWDNVYSKNVHSTMTRSGSFHCPAINKPTTVELWTLPVYRRLLWRNFLSHNLDIAHVTVITSLSGKIFHRQGRGTCYGK